ncbi:MAG: hypothetical protein JW798_14635 [Prolixibacteraceae bacterium]|nr:hypothetical protein [Prolixibacteraceae bacterium]
MKTISYLILLLTFFSACNNSNTKKTQPGFKVNEIYSAASEKADQTIDVTGMVNHVCSHSGRRCFLIDQTGEYSIRVEASGDIESFGKELIGKNIQVTGILKENRLMASEIDELENKYLAEHPEDANNNGEHCSAEMANINQMREWMKQHGKDYYAIYYIEGLKYEILQ